jgi:hypothetical protein
LNGDSGRLLLVMRRVVGGQRSRECDLVFAKSRPPVLSLFTVGWAGPAFVGRAYWQVAGDVSWARKRTAPNVRAVNLTAFAAVKSVAHANCARSAPDVRIMARGERADSVAISVLLFPGYDASVH